MYYTYNSYGFYTGTSTIKTDRCTTVQPPNDDSKKWNWNDVEWVGLPGDYQIPPVVSAPPTTP